MSFDQAAALAWAAGAVALVGVFAYRLAANKLPRESAEAIKANRSAAAVLMALVIVSWPLSVPLILAWHRLDRKEPV